MTGLPGREKRLMETVAVSTFEQQHKSVTERRKHDDSAGYRALLIASRGKNTKSVR